MMPGGVAHDQLMRAHRTSHHRAGPDHTALTYLCAADDSGVGANGGARPDPGGNYLPLLAGGTGTEVIREHRGRSDEDIVRELHPAVHRHVVLDLHPVPDLDALVDVHALSQSAPLADHRARADVAVMPDARTDSHHGPRLDDGGGMDKWAYCHRIGLPDGDSLVDIAGLGTWSGRPGRSAAQGVQDVLQR